MSKQRNAGFRVTLARFGPRFAAVACLALSSSTCARSIPTDPAPPPAPLPAPPLPAPPPLASAAPSASASAPAPLPRPHIAVDGPHDLPLAPGRTIYYARPLDPAGPSRLVAHLHGICFPPSYSCGRWLGAALDVGVLVCPTGNARCGDANV